MTDTKTHNENSNSINKERGRLNSTDKLTPEEVQHIQEQKDEKSGPVAVQVLNQEQVVSFPNGEEPAKFDVVLLSSEKQKEEKQGETFKAFEAAEIKSSEKTVVVIHEGKETKEGKAEEER